MTPVDENAQKLWDEYTAYKEKMFEITDTEESPWLILEANRKTKARIKAIRTILDRIPYKED